MMFLCFIILKTKQLLFSSSKCLMMLCDMLCVTGSMWQAVWQVQIDRVYVAGCVTNSIWQAVWQALSDRLYVTGCVIGSIWQAIYDRLYMTCHWSQALFDTLFDKLCLSGPMWQALHDLPSQPEPNQWRSAGQCLPCSPQSSFGATCQSAWRPSRSTHTKCQMSCPIDFLSYSSVFWWNHKRNYTYSCNLDAELI